MCHDIAITSALRPRADVTNTTGPGSSNRYTADNVSDFFFIPVPPTAIVQASRSLLRHYSRKIALPFVMTVLMVAKRYCLERSDPAILSPPVLHLPGFRPSRDLVKTSCAEHI